MTGIHWWIALPSLVFALVMILIPIVSSQSFEILLPPATPVTTDIVQGPPATPANLTAQPLPTPPDPALGTQSFDLEDTPPDGVIMSQGVPSNMLGISIELSVANNFLGDKLGEPSYILLNYLESLRVRAGQGAILRIGGNTQDTAIYDANYNGVIAKTGGGIINGVPVTPTVEYSSKVFGLIAQAASLVDAKVIWGVNMVNESAGFTVPMVAAVRKALDANLLFYLVGNEPDRYSLIGRRPADYTLEEYLDEWGNLTSKIISSDYSDEPRQFAAPSVCCEWTTEQVLTSGMTARFENRLAAITAIQYPQSMCSPHTPYGPSGYMNQSNIYDFVYYDADAVASAQQAGIPYYLVETNTASCTGVPDVSDTFTAAMWAVNMAMQFAFRNHSGVLLHNGGQTSVYNLFDPPAYNSTTTAWRTHPIMYSLLVLAEALRPTDPTKPVNVTDQEIGIDEGAAYNIYESGIVTKRVLINMANDASGANNIPFNFPAPAGNPASVAYKLLSAPSLAEKENVTWAGQTYGYYSEGKLTGRETILQAPCTAGNCTLSVPAPGVALVFMTTQTATEETAVTSTAFSPVGTNNPQIVLSSNGGRGSRGGATSKGSTKSSSALHSATRPSRVKTFTQSMAIVVLCAVLAALLG